MEYVLPIRDPELSELDDSGRPLLTAARHATVCTDCFGEIAAGRLCTLIDREMVCADCSTMYAPYRGPRL